MEVVVDEQFLKVGISRDGIPTCLFSIPKTKKSTSRSPTPRLESTTLFAICFHKIVSVILDKDHKALGPRAVLPFELAELLLESVARRDTKLIPELAGDWLFLENPEAKVEQKGGRRKGGPWTTVSSSHDSTRSIKRLAKRVVAKVENRQQVEARTWQEKGKEYRNEQYLRDYEPELLDANSEILPETKIFFTV